MPSIPHAGGDDPRKRIHLMDRKKLKSHRKENARRTLAVTIRVSGYSFGFTKEQHRHRMLQAEERYQRKELWRSGEHASPNSAMMPYNQRRPPSPVKTKTREKRASKFTAIDGSSFSKSPHLCGLGDGRGGEDGEHPTDDVDSPEPGPHRRTFHLWAGGVGRDGGRRENCYQYSAPACATWEGFRQPTYWPHPRCRKSSVWCSPAALLLCCCSTALLLCCSANLLLY